LRVIGGRQKGRKLHRFEGTGIRPTADRLREAIFNILHDRVPETFVLDLFAGTGALGIEAISRGAAFAVFVDHRTEATTLIRRNLSACGMSDRSRVVKWQIDRNLDCLKPYRNQFDLVFMDPPYDGRLVHPALANLKKSGVIGDGAWVVVEHAVSEPPLPRRPDLVLFDQRRYGKTLVSILTHVL
jgi:16S rRNA (guanine966-N2)-methyltransferase